MLSQFGHFWRDHRLTVTLIRIPFEVALVVLLSRMKHRRRHYLRHHRAPPPALSIDPRDHRFRDILLLRRVIENDRPVLRPNVMPLAIERGRIMNREEYFEQRLEADLLGIEENSNNLGMATVAFTYRAIARIARETAAVTGFNGNDTGHFLENRLQTPEATATQRGNLLILFSHSASEANRMYDCGDLQKVPGAIWRNKMKQPSSLLSERAVFRGAWR